MKRIVQLSTLKCKLKLKHTQYSNDVSSKTLTPYTQKTKDIGSVYVLKLVKDKYYVGFSKNVQSRIDQHFLGKGSIWTKRYKPVKVLQIYHNKDKGYEAISTIKLMVKHGVQHVRGGPWSTMKTPLDIQRHLEDTCFKCGSNAHFAKNCNVHSNT